MNTLSSPPSRLLNDVRTILRDARGKAYAAANATMGIRYALRSE